MDSTRRYYSDRHGKNSEAVVFSLDDLKRFFLPVYNGFEQQGWFQEHFGYTCVDRGVITGLAGEGPEATLLFSLRRNNLWPIAQKIASYSETDLFDVIEFLYDHISKPTHGEYHSWNNCGWHYHNFDKLSGCEEYRRKINQLLSMYSTGFELSSAGEILEIAPDGMGELLETPLPTKDQNILDRIESAKSKFRRYRSTPDERRDAVRDLADVLEYLKPKLEKVLNRKDESDLFNLANNFGIRHHKADQKTDYDLNIWLSWMFYFYLATINAALSMIDKAEKVKLEKKV